MSKYKLVPVEPTPEMLAAGEYALEAGCYASGIYADMLAAAPVVQEEPVATLNDHKCFDLEDANRIMRLPAGTKLYTTPQPGIPETLTQEQQPSAGDSLTSVPDEVFTAEFAAWWDEHGQFCRSGGGTYERTFAFEAWRHLYPQLMNMQMAAAEQHPDVAQLVEALTALRGCIMETRGPNAHSALELADAALAAYHKGEKV